MQPSDLRGQAVQWIMLVSSRVLSPRLTRILCVLIGTETADSFRWPTAGCRTGLLAFRIKVGGGGVGGIQIGFGLRLTQWQDTVTDH